MKHWKVSLGLVPAFLAVAGVAHSQTIAFDVASGTVGHQSFGGSLGLDFNVVSAIEITNLGFFDSGSNGIQGANTTITVNLFDRNNTAAPVATTTFTQGSPGTLASGSGFSFKSIPTLTVAAGFNGRIVASGFNASDPNGNTGLGDPAATQNTGGGLISFPTVSGVFGGYNDGTPGIYPTARDSNTYLAGSFEFQKASVAARTPEPGSIALLFGVTVPGLGFAYRRLRRK